MPAPEAAAVLPARMGGLAVVVKSILRAAAPRALRVAGAFVAAMFLSASHAADYATVTAVAGAFEDVKDNVRLAIEGQGLVVKGVSNVAEMLERTAADVGSSKKVFGRGEVFEFCSVSVSRQLAESDSASMVICPFTIAIYTLPDKPGKVFIAYRTPPAGAMFAPAQDMLKRIVSDAAH
jgi:uncharacterized protein (DUF302 family)